MPRVLTGRSNLQNSILYCTYLSDAAVPALLIRGSLSDRPATFCLRSNRPVTLSCAAAANTNGFLMDLHVISRLQKIHEHYRRWVQVMEPANVPKWTRAAFQVKCPVSNLLIG